MPRYPKHYPATAARQVDALISEGVKPVAAYRSVGETLGAPAPTVGRWYKARADKPTRTRRELKAAIAGTDYVAKDVAAADNVTRAFKRAVDGDDPKPTLADLAVEFEAVNREIPELNAKLDALATRRDELAKLIKDALGAVGYDN